MIFYVRNNNFVKHFLEVQTTERGYIVSVRLVDFNQRSTRTQINRNGPRGVLLHPQSAAYPFSHHPDCLLYRLFIYFLCFK